MADFVDWIISTPAGWRCERCGESIRKPVMPCAWATVRDEIAIAIDEHRNC